MSRSRKGVSSSPSEGKSHNLDAEMEKLRIATRQAHEVLAEIKQERKEVERVRNEIARLTEVALEKYVMAAIRIHLDDIGPSIQKVVDKASDHVVSEFDKLTAQLLGPRDADGKTALHRLVEKKKRSVEIVIGGGEIYMLNDDEDSNPTVPSTFGNGKR